ncbi:G1 family glutamic endopeptidase [Sulfobacillus thermosulfidooxidans]|uniref:G1 family glutamic endopeptidase n=1 Tax=Sulfobacillus thermosulfidooxidans TaxID=28034 RepID=UPI0009E8E615|nr:G1 family glutamic endopeptidase [Sulfobacillus thermosulfidooxidans]
MRPKSWAMSILTLSFAVISPSLSWTSATQALVHAPRLKLAPPSHRTSNYGWASSNWSGYAITNGPYSSITGQWIVPTVSPSHGSTYSSAWIGIDGFNNSDLIQTGTEQDYAQGKAQYSAWWEILPAAETVINEPVSPGDDMSASIVNDGGGVWTITLKDLTKGWTFSTNQAYSGPGSSAEWILEAPTIGGHIATLANYGQTTFNPGTANGQNPGLVSQDGGVMIQKNKQVSTPSLPDSDTDGFNVAYGSVAPSPPNS